MSTRHTLAQLKSIAYQKWGVSSTRQLKKLYFFGYDFRTRSAWLEAAGLAPLRELLREGANNIVPFCLLSLEQSPAEVDRIMDKDIYQE